MDNAAVCGKMSARKELIEILGLQICKTNRGLRCTYWSSGFRIQTATQTSGSPTAQPSKALPRRTDMGKYKEEQRRNKRTEGEMKQKQRDEKEFQNRSKKIEKKVAF